MTRVLRGQSLRVFGMFIFVTFLAGTNVLASTTPNALPGNAQTQGVGSFPWSNPTNVEAADGTGATCFLFAMDSGQYLYVSDFGFAVPVGSTIKGITVTVNRKATSHTNNIEDGIKLTKDGLTGVGSTHSTGSFWPLTYTLATVGSSNDLWGTTWTPAQVNSSDFGLFLTIDTIGFNDTGNIDYIKVQVTYTP